MAIKLVTVPESDFGGGIDSQSAPNKIPDGYIEDALNANPKPTGAITKRVGYQGYAGNIPVRVNKITSLGTNLTLQLDESIDLASIRSTPLVVMGRSSNSTGGDITTTDSTHYYDSFTAEIRTLIGTGTTNTSIPQTQHDLSTAAIWTGMSKSDSFTQLTNSAFFPNSVSVNKSTYDITVNHTNGTGSTFPAFLYYADRSNISTFQYFGNTTTQDATLPILVGTNTYTIPLATHQLSSNLILVKVFQDDGTNYIELQPDSVVINKLTKQVDITLTNGTGSSFNGIFSLAYAPAGNFKTGAVASNSSNTVNIDVSGYSDRTNFIFLNCFLDNGTEFNQVIPDSVVYDTVNSQIQVTFTDSGTGGANFSIYWQWAELTVKQLSVTQGSSATYTDTRPQLTVWGLDHSEIYASDETGWSKGWATHIDSYRSTAEGRIVTGLGGNLFAARTSGEGNYLMPTLYYNLQSLAAADAFLAPAFWDTGDTSSRSRGYITGNTGASNSFTVASVEYDSGLDWVKYTLSIPSMVIHGTLSTIISTGTLKDKLTIAGTAYSIHNGDFSIEQVSSGTDELYIWVSNSRVDSSDFDILSPGGYAGIFTDQLSLLTAPFIVGDKILNDLISEDTELLVYATNSNTIAVTGVIEEHNMPAGIKMLGERTASVLPLRDISGTADVTNLVRGDILSHSEVARQLRIKHINEMTDTAITIAAGDGELATVTLGSGTTASLWNGECVLIKAGTTYQGVFEIEEILSGTEFTIKSAYLVSDSAIIVGKTVQVDEVITVRDSTTSEVTFSVDERWIPVEAPDDSFDLTPTTYIHHFEASSYTEQEFLRSTMVKNSLFLTNGTDEVFKFDGNNLYRAGLPAFNPAVHITIDTTATGKIDASNPSSTTTSVSSQNIFHVSLDDELVFKVGDYIKHSLETTARPYRIVSINPDSASPSTKIHIAVDRNIGNTSSGGTLTRVSRFKYYVRFNAVDVNQAIIASAVVGSDDLVAEMSSDAAVRIRLTGLPVYDVYDFDAIDVEIYRTKENTTAPFYKIASIPVTFNNNSGSLTYVDTAADTDLVNLDAVSTAIEGAELGRGWSEPLRAKYLTSAGNKLVLGNLTDYPKLDIFLKKNATVTEANLADKYFMFRRDNTDTNASNFDMVNRALYRFRNVSTAGTVNSVAATTSTFTVTTSAAHGLAAGNWVYLFRNAEGNFDNKWSGWWMVQSAPTTTTFVVACENDGTAPATTVNRFLTCSTKTEIPVPVGLDGNYGVLNGNTVGTVEFKAMKRMADAINATMRQVNTTVISGFKPWMIAYAGSEYNAGQMIVQSPAVEQDKTLEVVISSFSGSNCNVYINDILRGTGAEVSAITKLYPSRIIASYANFPEVFDSPSVLQDIDSASAIDVNPADGQEITALIPFFGDSAFGAAQKSGVIVVFKTNSIYLVDLAAKDAGTQAVQKIESQGKGCTAPYSVTVTRDGIVFANTSGIYRLNRNLQVDYLGRKVEGKFKELVDKDQLWNAHGHHDHIDNKFKLSVVGPGETTTDSVLVYDHVREYESESQRDGSWTVYDNHPAIGYANLESDSYFASSLGRVFKKRRTGTDSDYRDDDKGVAMTVITKATSFGDSGIRKVVSAINTHYIGQDSEGTSLSVALDLVDNFDATDSFIISSNASTSGLSDSGAFKVNTLQSTINKAKGIFFQIKYENSTIDEPLEIVGVDWRVAGLNEKGIRQAAGTK